MRKGTVERATRETRIRVSLDLDGTGESKISTGIGFMDHMLTLFAKHGKIDLEVVCDGDLEVDAHHTMEDLGIVMGECLCKALGDKKGINRYGNFLLPMDESLVLVALDFSGRPFLAWDLVPPAPYIKDLDTELFREYFRALCVAAGLNLHVKLLSGGEVHHVFEAVFKGVAHAMRTAVESDPRENGIPSTKGVL
ncbi:MAG: imidazoleglycerol-phosphate dehydratase HisB [Lentisphaeria bacterium]|nr:imidazoleglycerol-phosphate dehydratase HisB [Lentisphaeria bacterium]